ncbi:MAG TPA: PilZ domain-containing protein [Vicinamibacteria bacterium]|nr:PilZ domain-containing protein [Vicinamibacteria bacterium]
MSAKDRDAPRRRSPRLPIRLEGSLSGRASRDVTLVDLSVTGCLLRSCVRLDHGAILDLSLHLDDGPLAAKVRVTETSLDGACAEGEEKRYLTGLEFLGLPPRDAERLRKLMSQERRKRSADAPAH